MRTLLLSGWAQLADALTVIADDALMFDYSDHPAIATALRALEDLVHTHRPDACIAWSLGGVVALHAIAAGVMAPRHLTLIGTPYQFVQTADYREAMDDFTYRTFHDNYASNPTRTKDRFHALVARGDADAKQVLAALRHHPDVANTTRWLPWLRWLAAGYDIPSISTPTLLIHGRQDAIVPVAQAQHHAERMPQATVSIWEEAAHAPHLHHPARLRAEIAAHRARYGL